MSVLKSCVIAFSMYSGILVPQFDWKEEDMKYVMVFFPWVGIVIGFVTLLWGAFCMRYQAGPLLFCTIGAATALLLSGGIHLDGYMDTMDAFHSWQDKEKKLEILKDAHIGAFSVIWLVLYYLIYLGAYSELLGRRELWCVAIGFWLSRILSGIGVVTLCCAKKDGLLCLFADRAHKRRVRFWLYVQLVLCGGLLYLTAEAAGAAVLAGGIAVFFYYRRRSYRELGGITGDTAGYFVTVCEGAVVVIAALFSVLGAG